MEGRSLKHERKSQHSIRGELEERRMDGLSRIGRGMEGRWMSKGVRFCIETMERGRSVWRMGGGGEKGGKDAHNYNRCGSGVAFYLASSFQGLL